MPIIETRNLCKRYGTVMRVTNLALQVPEGSISGFLGPNGAGKSTTLKMILGLVRPTQGEIQVFGQPMNRGNRIAVLRQVGSLIESPSYYGHLTGEENLRIVQTLRGLPPKAIREVLEIVRLARALMVRGSITASMTARLYSRDIQPWANSLGSIWVKVRPIHASCTATKARQIRAIFLRRHLKNSIRSSFIGSLPFPL